MVIPRIVVAGTHSGVGKTTVATGLMAAFAGRGLEVAGFKVGPDFIDPSYHALATGRPGRNLDAFLSGPELIAPLLLHGAEGADVAVIEGVMGLFDGKAGGGELASTAQVARLLEAPVVLVVDASAMARSAAAVVHGFATFDPGLRLAGVILNRVGSDGHEVMLREALAPLEIPVLGAIRRSADLRAPERHLGLVPAVERAAQGREQVAALGAAMGAALDLDLLLALARSARPLDDLPWEPPAWEWPPVRVAIASGPAFSFRYRENLESLEAAGAELCEFDPLRDEALPEGAEALYLGGGFPEVYAAELAENRPLRQEVAALAAAGLPVAAECGGLLYLARELDGREMCGVLPASARMTDRLTLGYREAVAAADSPLCSRGQRVRGHEFHYSAVVDVEPASPAWRLQAGGGEREEGFVVGRVHASYLHTHWAGAAALPARLVRSAAAAARR
ncbi:MAG: cobyrinic acid a,c-diamide synthase [Miltoncostaeaceae bacterium]|nr:cobyrinic acid a,c-diamide synthase [Miltoncostaeaceae bacterium]